MATYAISDIHGQYDLFMELLDKIRLTKWDRLYILGDVLDRGPHPIKTIRKLMEMPNVICLAGNHEIMAMQCQKLLMSEITDSAIRELDEDTMINLQTWQFNGSETTIRELAELDQATRRDVIEYIKDFYLYMERMIREQKYLLVHAGLGNFYPQKPIRFYTVDELVWTRAEYDIQYFKDRYVVTGHTPTQLIAQNPHPGYIYRCNNHIAIDCGACMPGGRLAALCLDTGEEFYSSDVDNVPAPASSI